ncbi:MAG: site-specific DNA-methyltransferase [Armatimonadaceae bacterium]
MALDSKQGNLAYDLMHKELDKVWAEVARVLTEGCFVCINIGDATRTIADRFRLYANHSRITQAFVSLGFDVLPPIIWKKTTNAPNKFMGSGMLPAGAYVTLEHEYILIFRKGGKRRFVSESDKAMRNASGFFWEERNRWFSDIWDIKGTRQKLSSYELRDRSAAYPFEIPYRFINMYSVYGDTILDPFVGTGTTMAAAVATGRNSIGVEIESAFLPLIEQTVLQTVLPANQKLKTRIACHLAFVAEYQAVKGIDKLKYTNHPHGFPVMTAQECGIKLWSVEDVTQLPDNSFCANYTVLGNPPIVPHMPHESLSLFGDSHGYI